MSHKLLKIGSIIVSVGGIVIGLASDFIGKKTMANEIVKSNEFQDLVAKNVERIVNSGK